MKVGEYKEDEYCIRNFGYNEVKDYEDLKQLEDEKHLIVEELEYRLQQKENIIKEVREYIKNNTYKIEWGDLEQDNEDINISEDLTEKEFIENLLEILDKGEDKE